MTSGTRWTASPACFTTLEATRLARATGDCFRLRLPPERLRPDDFFDDFFMEEPRRADFRPDLRPLDLRADDFFAADFFRLLDFRPPRRPPERALPRDDRFFVAMALHSKLKVGCPQMSARIARALHPSAARVDHHLTQDTDTHTNIAHQRASCEGARRRNGSGRGSRDRSRPHPGPDARLPMGQQPQMAGRKGCAVPRIACAARRLEHGFIGQPKRAPVNANHHTGSLRFVCGM